MDTTFLHLWNGWSILFLALFSLNMMVTGHLCSRKGLYDWQPLFMLTSGLLLGLIFAFSGLLALILSVPSGLFLALFLSKALFPDWSKGHVDPPIKFPVEATKQAVPPSDDQKVDAA